MAQLGGVKVRTGAVIAVAMLAAGCHTKPTPPPGVTPRVEVGVPLKSDTWKQLATAADEDRLNRLGQAWSSALADVRRSTASSELRKEGVLLRPDSALSRPAPTPGSYNCRLIKLARATPKSKT